MKAIYRNLLNSNKGVDILFVFCITILLIYLRKGNVYLHPQFWAEDSWVFLKDAYYLKWDSLWLPYNGYQHLFPRIWAIISELCRLPLSWIPGWYNLGWWLWWGILVREIFQYSGADRLKSIALSLTPVVFAVASESVVNLTNTHWLMAMWLLVLLLRWTSVFKVGVFHVAGIILVGLSGPHTVILLPALVYIAVIYKLYMQKKFWFICVIWTITCCFQLWFLLDSDNSTRNLQQETLHIEDAIFFVGKLPAYLLFPWFSEKILAMVLGVSFWVFFGLLAVRKRKSEHAVLAISVLSFLAITLFTLQGFSKNLNPLENGSRYYYFILFGLILAVMLFKSKWVRVVFLLLFFIPGIFTYKNYTVLKLHEYPLYKLNSAFRKSPFLLVPGNPTGFNLLLDDMNRFSDSLSYPMYYHTIFEYSIDRVQESPEMVIISGWVCPDTNSAFSVRLALLLPLDTVYIQTEEVIRPDVAEKYKAPICISGGFDFHLIRAEFPLGIHPVFLEVKFGDKVFWRKINYTFSNLPKDFVK